ncbi:ECF-type sigma factor [Aquimonas voraii]|uniref:RNA polymerase sigma factor, TIGR02999 family n=1 Tax=Aquimonas voraii TaxID=265719 RepID=A0A1G6XZW5_9GAMM|nr:ECF-type sigma factor [Aquimonas voraii]SDD82925.1 RNA polymerase sigma factor, TIGR02999 family [Aquimonas voraii]
MSDITQLLRRWSAGEQSARDSLLSALYPLLKDMARRQLGRGPSVTLQPTDLLHSAYERLQIDHGREWVDRSQFLAIASVLIRNTLIDHLRGRSSQKRGGDVAHTAMDVIEAEPQAPGEDPQAAVGLDAVLNRLAEIEPACAQVVVLKVFAGFQTDEIAEALGSSTATVGRQWRFARAWLAENL